MSEFTQQQLIYQETLRIKPNLVCCFNAQLKKSDEYKTIDFLTMDEQKQFRCYKIINSLQNFNERISGDFLGDFNYYIMPKSVYEQIKGKTEYGIGVYITEKNTIKNVEPARRKTVYEHERNRYCYNMLKSMQKYTDFYIKNKERDKNKNANSANHT